MMATWPRCSSTAAAVVAGAEVEAEVEVETAAAAAGAALDAVARKRRQHRAGRHDEGYGLRTDSRYGTECELAEVVTGGYHAVPPIASQSSGSVGRRPQTHRPAGRSSRRVVVMALDDWTHCLWCSDQHPGHQHLLTGIDPSERVFSKRP